MMARMKRVGLLAILLTCGLLLWAEASPGATASSGGTGSARNLNVLTSFYPMHIMALNVFQGIPGVTLEMLAPPMTGCLHDYSLTTEAMRRLEKADILIANGLGMESYLSGIVKKYPRLEIVQLSGQITPLRGGHGPNPHVWVSVGKAGLQVTYLYQFMARVDPGHSDAYRENGHAYVKRLEALRKEMHGRLDRFQGAAIVTFHEAFPYFAEEFGFKVAGVIKREPGSAPSPRELVETIAVIRKLKVKGLFSEPQYPSTAAEIISRETGLKVYLLDPAVIGPMTVDAYIEIMRKNLVVLEEALQ